ncbi:MAG: N-6 DNA methylase [Desulfovibrionaceae bacterium]|nr:N-6 DNA methylase [Desulfovibrionaceae bacterium]
MPPLDKTLRSQLERTIKEARHTAEDAARAALGQLEVAESNPSAHLGEQERVLRHKLRAHGRQLGDALNGGKVQTMDHLVEEVAYEHWHRMLFARFLAENNLLMYPDPDDPVAVTLEECEDLAAEEGAANGWELAARFASRMLPQIFRLDSPVFGLSLPPEHQQKLERLLTALPPELFRASDSLGWVYQYWQADNKERINNSEVRIGARELPAVTQLFTEPYMVSFLLDNSLGAWWAAKRLTKDDLRNAESEEELRRKAAIPGVPLNYLRFVRQADKSWTLAAGTFADWPEDLSQFKLLDPCCGSGHFLVAAFLMLVPMRVAMEKLSPRDAVHAVLRENLHGLELDQRCVKLAAFALAFAAWTYTMPGDPAGPLGYGPLPELHLACSGLPVTADKAQWTGLAQPHTALRNALDLLYDEFKKAPALGSLLAPSEGIAARIADMDMTPLLRQTLAAEDGDDARQEAAVMAQGLAKAAALLAQSYTLVITNVPYLARGKQADTLRDFCEARYPEAKNDLATVFLERCLKLCARHGTVCAVLPQNWLFLASYKKFREKLLKQDVWHLLARLGEKGFESSAAAGAFVILLTLSREKARPSGGLMGMAPVHMLHGLDVSAAATAQAKAEELQRGPIQSVEQAKQLENPDARVGLEEVSGELLAKYADGLNGIHGADSCHFRFYFWEVTDFSIWHFLQCTCQDIKSFGGRHYTFYWAENGKCHRENPNARVQGEHVWDKNGVVVSMMRTLPVTLYSGNKFDISCTPIVPHNPAHLPAIWCFCSSPEYNEAVRQVDQSLKVTNATLTKVPFDLEHWQKVAEEKYPHGLPKPYSDDPTQWIFHGHPCGSVVWDEEGKRTARGELRKDDTVLQVAVARLLGYRWPAELDAGMDLAEEQREWVKRCDALAVHADDDGIVCIPPVRGEASASDRLLNLLADAYGEAWSNDVLAELLTSADHAGKSLETWLREKFFAQHCKLFQNRPFIWHIWDGLRDGFAALVNYHKLNHKNLETLIYTYVGDWISRQKQDIANGVDGARERLAAAENLKKKLETILEGESPHDIFVRWKPLREQPLGWNPDLNDGVRLNIRPFLTIADVGKKGAGVLRDKPNIKWDKDRGKDVESSPWFNTFHGDRINNHHLTLAEKLAARETAK